MAAARRHTTRQRDGYRLSGRPADAWDCLAARRQAAVGPRGEDHHQNSCIADFLCRCTAVLGCTRGPRGPTGLARRSAGHLPLGAWTCESASADEVELGPEDALRCDRAHVRL